MTPTGTMHAVLFTDAYESVAVCGQRVIAWPGKPFLATATAECAVCRNIVQGLD